VIADKVQGADGGWAVGRLRALHGAVVTISEVYDNLVADELARRLPVSWGWRSSGPRRTPAFEVAGIDDDLLAAVLDAVDPDRRAMTGAVAQFMAAHGRSPNRIKVTPPAPSRRPGDTARQARPLPGRPVPRVAPARAGHDRQDSRAARRRRHADLQRRPLTKRPGVDESRLASRSRRSTRSSRVGRPGPVPTCWPKRRAPPAVSAWRP